MSEAAVHFFLLRSWRIALVISPRPFLSLIFSLSGCFSSPILPLFLTKYQKAKHLVVISFFFFCVQIPIHLHLWKIHSFPQTLIKNIQRDEDIFVESDTFVIIFLPSGWRCNVQEASASQLDVKCSGFGSLFLYSCGEINSGLEQKFLLQRRNDVEKRGIAQSKHCRKKLVTTQWWCFFERWRRPLGSTQNVVVKERPSHE